MLYILWLHLKSVIYLRIVLIYFSISDQIRHTNIFWEIVCKSVNVCVHLREMSVRLTEVGVQLLQFTIPDSENSRNLAIFVYNWVSKLCLYRGGTIGYLNYAYMTP